MMATETKDCILGPYSTLSQMKNGNVFEFFIFKETKRSKFLYNLNLRLAHLPTIMTISKSLVLIMMKW
jgi:hypothetical protein